MADPITGEAFKCALSHVEREVGYLFHFKSNISDLNVNVENLIARRDDVMRLIDAAKLNNEVILKTVETWLSHVENVLNAVTNLNGKAVRINRWYKGWVLCSRFSTGRSGEKMSVAIKELLADGNSIGDTVAYRRLNQNLVPGDLESSAKFEPFGSRVTTANEIIRALKDDAITLLGVYGMPGVGKTTLMSALAAYMKKQKIFDEVVVVTLTQAPEVKAIQGDIANWLDLKLEDGDTRTRAAQLSQRLSQDRETLIVLENLWQYIKLAEVGIPESLKNCKVVFTTRDTDVCNAMGSKKDRIKVEVLSPSESLDLFRKNAGEAVDSPSFKEAASNILIKCQGLPLLIVTLGKALYEKNIGVWEAALQSLQNSTYFLESDLFIGAPYVFSIMRLSYDSLEREDIKLCFLLCCLFPQGYPISKDQLFHYMVGENILPDVATLQQRRHHLNLIVDKLISSCLLLQNAKSGCIMMHDIVREVALAIASGPKEGRGFIFKARMTMRDWRHKQIADCKRLSFITTRSNRINWSLPSQIQAAHLLTMSFNGNEKLEEIPSDFFREATSLLSLDLSYTGIKRLPQSIICLVNLRTLLLEGCFHLKGVDLSNDSLEILSLRDSMIKSFAVSGQMTSLKLLDLSHTSSLQHIDRNIISSFIELEELYLFYSFKAWDPEEREPEEKAASSSKGKGSVEEEYASFLEGMEQRRMEQRRMEQRRDYARLSEVASLHGLTSLEFHVGNPECMFQNNFSWEKLERFKIAVGVIKDFSPFGVDDGLKMEKSMYINHYTRHLTTDDHRVVATWFTVLLRRTQFLQLSGPWSLSDHVLQDLEQGIFSDLKVLIMSDSFSVTSIIPCDLRNVTKLVVTKCINLEKLIGPSVEYQASSSLSSFSFFSKKKSSSLQMLTYLRVGECADLRFLFPMTAVQLLPQLEKLYISDCPAMMMVIEGGGGSTDTDIVILPKLKILSLERLSILSHIVEEDVQVEWNSFEELTVKGCPKLWKLPFGPNSVPKFKKLMVDNEDGYRWWDELKWDDQNVRHRLQLLLHMYRVSINGCRSLNDVKVLEPWPYALRGLELYDFKSATLIPCEWLQRLRSLESLGVDLCPELEKLIDFGGEDMASRKQVTVSDNSVVKFPKLTPSPVFDNLRCLKVSRCYILRYLFPMRVVRALSQLQELHIDGCIVMEMIIVQGTDEEDLDLDADEDKKIFPKLRVLYLCHLGRLLSILQQDILLDCPSLEELTILNISDLKKLPLGPASAPNLRRIVAPNGWSDRMEWGDEKLRLRLEHIRNSTKW